MNRRIRRLVARRGILWVVAVGVTLMIAAIWLAILYESTRARARAMASSGDVLSSLAIAFAAHVDRTLVGIDQALLAIRDDMARGEGTHDFAWSVAAAPALRDLGVALVLLDAGGTPVAGSEPVPLEPGSLAAFRFFADHRAGGDRLVVSRPELSPISLRCDFFASRPIRDRAGQLTGVLVASIRPGYLIDLYAQASLGTDGAVALIDDEGAAWARWGSAPPVCGRRLADLDGMIAQHRIERDLLEVPSPVDGLLRLVAFQRVEGWPFRVFVGMAMDDVLAAARREGWRYIAFGAALTITLSAGAVLIGQDVTKRQRVQRLLRRVNLRLARSKRTAEAHRQQLIASVLHGRDGISIFDAAGRLVLSNFAHRELFGYPEALVRPGTSAIEHLRFQVRRGDFGPVTDVEAEAQRLFRRFRTDPPLHFERVFPDGRRVRYRRAVTPGGGTVTLYTDVTEERRQIAGLREQRRAAVAASERKSELLGLVGHDIRTPMTGIVGFLDLIERTDLTLEQRTYLGMAAGSARALLALLDDVLMQARIDDGRVSLQPGDCAIDSLLQDTTDLFRPAAARKGVAIRVRRAAGLPPRLWTDGIRLRQILGNLVANAVRMTPAGEIVIAAEEADAAGRWLRISVADDGPGVPEEERGAVFEPYYQGAGGQTEGSGLGLAISRRLVELFGGRIEVGEAPSGGALFWFTVPLMASGTALPPPAAPAADERLRALVVEDNAANQFLARRILEHLGHEAVVVSTAVEAEHLLGAQHFSFVILDRRLPDGDGLDLLRRVRARHGGNRLVIILATAAAGADRDAAIAAGADRYLAKPYGIDELAQAIAASRWERGG